MVLYEYVFGEKDRWSPGGGGDFLHIFFGFFETKKNRALKKKNRAIKWAIIIRFEPFLDRLEALNLLFQSVQKRRQTDNYCPFNSPILKNVFLRDFFWFRRNQKKRAKNPHAEK